jgi:hypothetical protein
VERYAPRRANGWRALAAILLAAVLVAAMLLLA